MVTLLDLKKLKIHERTSRSRLQAVKKMIFASAYFREPIIVDKKNFIILDGHHRVRLLKQLGYKKVPAYLVDYQSREVTVTSRRDNCPVSKDSIILRALSGRPYPYKTSRHSITDRPKNLKIKFCELK